MKGDKKSVSSRNYLLTSPHRPLTSEEYEGLKYLQDKAYDYSIATEGKEEDGSQHVHIALRFEFEALASDVRHVLPGWNVKASEENAWDDILEYTKKEGNYYHKREELPALYADADPRWRSWQRKLLDTIKENEPRKVICVVDERGGAGKTYFAMWHAVRHRAAYVPCMQYKDIMRMAYNIPYAQMYIFDLPRALTKKQMAHVYASAETIRNGYCFDDRYQWRARFFDPVPTIIYTNQMPDMEQLSVDRWIFIYPDSYKDTRQEVIV